MTATTTDQEIATVNEGTTTRRQRYRVARQTLRNFQAVAAALGADPEAAVRRFNELGEAHPEWDNDDVSLAVLAELIEPA